MFGWKAKPAPEETSVELEPVEREEDAPTWSDGSHGPANPVSRIYGRLRNDDVYEAHVAAAD
jgi:hypothetical protein